MFYVGGIKNLANTCYLGSSLQLIYRYKPFVDCIKKNQNISEFQILSNFFHSFSTQNTSDPTPIIDMLNINYTEQHDLTEFLTKFIEFLGNLFPNHSDNEILDIFTSNTIISTDIPIDNFIFYTIPVQEYSDVQDIIYNQMQYNKSLFYKKKADLFFVLLNRMEYDKENHLFKKNLGAVFVPESLDLTAFGGQKYYLYAVSTHIGSGFKGHYITYVQDKDGWIEINDDIIKEISKENAHSSFNDGNKNAYVIAYVSKREDIITLREKVECSTDDLLELTNISQIENKYNLFVKMFAPETMTVSEVHHKMLTKEDSNDILNNLNEAYSVKYSIDDKNISEQIPHEFYDNFSTLYLYCQQKDRIFLDDVFFMKPVKFEFVLFQTQLAFEGKFHSKSKTSEFFKFVRMVLFKFFHLEKKEFQLLMNSKKKNGPNYFYKVTDNIGLKTLYDSVTSKTVTIVFSELLSPHVEQLHFSELNLDEFFGDHKSIKMDVKNLSGMTTDKYLMQTMSPQNCFYQQGDKWELIKHEERPLELLYMLSWSSNIFFGPQIEFDIFECYEISNSNVFLFKLEKGVKLGEILSDFQDKTPSQLYLAFSKDRINLIDDPEYDDFFTTPKGCFVYNLSS